jgi:serine/threonine protein kinase
MTTKAAAPIGTRLGSDLTVLGHIDMSGREPVYIVWHHQSWCPMACKVFSKPERATREAEVLGALHHPYVVRSLGVCDEVHLLMEFLEGPTLDSFARSRPKSRMSQGDAVRVAIHLGAALQHVHLRGWLHMDVKPSNVILARGRPVLYDFGIARRHENARPSRITGTDPYMAPEECLLEPVTTAADVFGLGVTLFEVLTGDRPWPRGTKEIPFPQTSQPPKQPRELRPRIPAALNDLVLECLARPPGDRPSLRELLPQLHRHIRRGPMMWPVGFSPLQDSAVGDALANPVAPGPSTMSAGTAS